MGAYENRKVLLSVKPKYAHLIFLGRKKIEVRKRIPKWGKKDLVFVYASYPTKKILGVVNVAKKEVDTISELWEKIRMRVAISKEEYDNYFVGHKNGVGIYLENVQSFGRPISLDQLRSAFDEFVVPQSYRYLSQREAKKIMKMGGL